MPFIAVKGKTPPSGKNWLSQITLDCMRASGDWSHSRHTGSHESVSGDAPRRFQQ